MKHILKAHEEYYSDEKIIWDLIIYDDETGEINRITEYEYTKKE